MGIEWDKEGLFEGATCGGDRGELRLISPDRRLDSFAPECCDVVAVMGSSIPVLVSPPPDSLTHFGEEEDFLLSGDSSS